MTDLRSPIFRMGGSPGGGVWLLGKSLGGLLVFGAEPLARSWQTVKVGVAWADGEQ